MAGQTELPGPEEPQIPVVLVPRDDAANAPTWVFPFDRPEAASGQDSQALAVNTEDGSVVYDVAFALVWADNDRVDTTNEAYAFASCSDCAAVAVSFQVVLVVGQADVVIPQNLSGAVNYDCVECVTYALASQLVVTLDGALNDDTLSELDTLWAEIAEYGRSIRDRPLSELADALAGFKLRILEILRADPASGLPEDGTTPSPAEPSPVPTTGGSPAPEPGSGTTPEPEAPVAPEDATQDEPTDSNEPTPTPSPEPSTEAPTSDGP